jgi:mevalonate pyrophosphate decarboxylase
LAARDGRAAGARASPVIRRNLDQRALADAARLGIASAGSSRVGRLDAASRPNGPTVAFSSAEE